MRALAVGKVLGWLSGAVVLASIGCGPPSSVTGPFTMRKENTQLKAALRQYRDQLAQAKQRRENLDADNEDLHNLLAREQEESRRLRSELDTLSLAANTPSTGAVSPPGWNDPKEFGPAGSRRAGSALAVSNSESQWLPVANISGAEVSRDGQTVRIRITSAGLFESGRATLKPSAISSLRRIASVIRRDYPEYLVGIEGHTDADPIRKSKWKSNHELSVRRAMAVYDFMRTRGGIPSNQLFVAGYGPNMPVASNGSASGKARNRRVEFVVHPITTQMARQRALRR